MDVSPTGRPMNGEKSWRHGLVFDECFDAAEPVNTQGERVATSASS